MQDRDARGNKPTCLCGECAKCRLRPKRREYMRLYNAGLRRPRPIREPRRWTVEEDVLLGTNFDDVVGSMIGVTPKAVLARRRRLGIPCYRKPTTRSKGGYIAVFVSSIDPMAVMKRRGDSRVLEHRLVMARMLGRPLADDEFVHHRNGIRSDNRPENLELWTRSHPDGQRVEDVLQWCVEFVERYDKGIFSVAA